MHFIVFIIVLYADIDLNFFISLFPNYKIVLYGEIAYLIIPAVQTLVNCIVHGKAYKLNVLLWYECYCIVILCVLKVVHLVGLSRLSASKSCENLVPLFAQHAEQTEYMFIVAIQLGHQTVMRQLLLVLNEVKLVSFFIQKLPNYLSNVFKFITATNFK